MSIPRRDLLKGFAASAALCTVGVRPALSALTGILPRAELPRKQDFDLSDGNSFLDAAYTHPIPRPATDAVRSYLSQRNKLSMPRAGAGGGDGGGPTAKTLFAELINASPAEIAYVPNTSTGENLVVNALGLDRATDANVVTDWLHFDGALVHLLELQRRGLDVRVVKPTRDYRIDLHDIERVMDRKTKLVELSSTTMYNGFQHDLTAVCQLAHAHGAWVYADIIHTAGAEPFDVRASGVDFAACSSFKWLMGDFGLGFLYVREALLGTVIQRPHWSYESTSDSDIHLSPFDPQSATPIAWTPGTGAAATFELGTMASGVAAALSVSLPYIQQLGLDRIVAHRQPMMAKLQAELPRLGFTPQTPSETTGPIVTFAHDKEAEINRRLDKAKITVRVAKYWMRVSPSVYNDMADIDRLLEVLS